MPSSAFASTWSLQTTANVVPHTESQVEGTSCPSSTMCMAVGEDKVRSKGFAEVWNGSEWTLVPNSLTLAPLKAVSCPSTTMCMALAKGQDLAYRLHWMEAGHFWAVAIMTPPVPEPTTETRLDGVSCPSASTCFAVGADLSLGRWEHVADVWSSTTEAWTRQATAVTESGAKEAMLSVSCSSATSCVSVGTSGNRPYTMRSEGGEWVFVESLTSGASFATLEDVSCPSATFCAAVGHLKEGEAGHDKTLAYRYDGHFWYQTATPAPEAKGNADLRGVSCTSATSCIAVGGYVTKLKPTGLPEEEVTLVNSWNGTTWSAQTSANRSGTKFNSLQDVACTASTVCTAVGDTYPVGTGAGEEELTLGERYE